MSEPTLKKILVLRLSSIGDIILSTPFLRVMKTHFQECELHFVIREEYADLLRYNPHVNRLIQVDVKRGHRALEMLNLQLMEERYDAVFDLHNHLRTRIIRNGLSSRIHHIDKRSLRRLLLVTTRINLYRDFTPIPVRYIETAMRYDVLPDDRGCELFTTAPADSIAVATLTAQSWTHARPLLGVCPGSRHFTKRWPLERFAELCTSLLNLNYDVIVFGAEEDSIAGETLHRIDPTRIFNLCGRLSLLETAAAMRLCTAIVANDSGLMHMAAAVGRPVTAVFGSTVREFGFFPYKSAATVLEINGLSCRPCTFIGRSSCPKRHLRCLLETTASDVLGALLKLIETEARRD